MVKIVNYMLSNPLVPEGWSKIMKLVFRVETALTMNTFFSVFVRDGASTTPDFYEQPVEDVQTTDKVSKP